MQEESRLSMCVSVGAHVSRALPCAHVCVPVCAHSCSTEPGEGGKAAVRGWGWNLRPVCVVGVALGPPHHTHAPPPVKEGGGPATTLSPGPGFLEATKGPGLLRRNGPKGRSEAALCLCPTQFPGESGQPSPVAAPWPVRGPCWGHTAPPQAGMSSPGQSGRVWGRHGPRSLGFPGASWEGGTEGAPGSPERQAKQAGMTQGDPSLPAGPSQGPSLSLKQAGLQPQGPDSEHKPQNISVGEAGGLWRPWRVPGPETPRGSACHSLTQNPQPAWCRDRNLPFHVGWTLLQGLGRPGRQPQPHGVSEGPVHFTERTPVPTPPLPF